MPVASFKLHFVERRARIVPELDASGCPFAGPGVDLVGGETDEALALAAPLLAWLQAREPVRVRTMSLDVRRRRLLVTVDAQPRPRVVRIDARVDAAASAELVALAGPLIGYLGRAVHAKLAARRHP